MGFFLVSLKMFVLLYFFLILGLDKIFTPIPNGTFLAGITRNRHISNLTADGYKVHEKVISFKDVDNADEVFMSGNMMKVTPVKAFNSTNYQIGPITKKTRELYWDWAKSI